MRIQHNISAINANRQLGINNNSVSKNLEKLSSGYKINRAGDDAAGLAISEKMRSQIRGLDQATNNANDGISLVQTAEGALNETHSILQRMKELATQSSNGTYQNDVDRENIQKEVDALKEEINRISTSTNFNKINLLDGTQTKNPTGAIGQVTTTDAVAGSFADTSTASVLTMKFDAAFKAGDTLEIGGQKFAFIDSTSTDDALKNAPTGYTAIDVNTQDDKVKQAAAIKGALTVSGYTAAVGTNAGVDDNILTITSDTKGAGTALDDPKATTADKSAAPITVTNADGVTNAAKEAKNATATYTIDWSKVNVGDKLKIGSTEFTLVDTVDTDPTKAKTQMAFKAGDAAANSTALIDALNRNTDTFGVNDPTVVQGTGDNASKTTFTFEAKGSDVTASALKTAVSATLTPASAGGATGIVLQIGAGATADQQVSLNIEDMSSKGLGIDKISVLNQDSAKAAIDTLESAINHVSGTRADLGALQNRLEHTVNNLGVTSENLTSAESRVRDVDMAKEMMEMTKNNVLTQAAQSMLAQANQQPQNVLKLLQ